MGVPPLDSRTRKRELSCVRRVVVTGILLLVVTPVAARTRVHVPPFAVARGGESLAYFGPEVARAISDALEAAGVEAGASGELTVSGRIEELGAERVRLIATARGRSVSAEGPLENIDAVAGQLAQRVQLLVEPSVAQAHEAVHAKPVPHPSAPATEHKAAAAPAAASTPAAVAAPAPPVAAAPVSTPKEAAKDSAPAPAAVSPPAPSPSPVAHAEEEPRPPAPSPPPLRASRPDPYEYLPTTSPPPPSPSYPGYGTPSYVRGRVVAHAVAEVPNVFAGTGASATQALFNFLRRRMGLSIVPTGYGLQPPQVAADEAWRSGARAVVMARLAGVEYRPLPTGQSVSCRVEVMVVRDGRTVLRRIVDSGPTDPSLRRGRYYEDPISQAVTLSLESIFPELLTAVQ